MRNVCFSIALTLGSTTLYSEELHENFVPVRPTGMGGANTAVAMDENAMWTNPAGIARIRKNRSRKKVPFLTFPNVVAGANKRGQKILKSARSGNAKTKLEEALSGYSSSETEPIWAFAAANPQITLEFKRGWPILVGGFSVNRVTTEIDSTGSAQVRSVSDVGGVIGAVINNRTNRFNLGVQVRPTTRYAYDDKVPISTLTNRGEMRTRISRDSNIGLGYGVDVGLLWTFADFWFPTIGLAALNLPTGCRANYLNPHSERRETICGTVYTGTTPNENSLFLVDPTDFRVGLSLTPRLHRKIAIRFAGDLHHLSYTAGSQTFGLSGIKPSKRLHGGVELVFGNPILRNPLVLQAGYSQGMISYGAVLNLGFLSMKGALYKKDLSSTAEQIPDERAVASLSMEF